MTFQAGMISKEFGRKHTLGLEWLNGRWQGQAPGFGHCPGFPITPSYGSFSLPRTLWERRQWQPTLVLLPGKSHWRRSLVGCSPWGREESDTTEQLHFHFSFSCIGEGNGNPLQCSRLENPRDGGAWWAAVYRVAQSRARLKRLSSSSSRTLWKGHLFWEEGQSRHSLTMAPWKPDSKGLLDSLTALDNAPDTASLLPPWKGKYVHMGGEKLRW